MKKTWKILQILLLEGGKDQQQMNIWMHLTNPDVQELHNPCFCPKTDQIDTKPDNKYINCKRKNLPCHEQNYALEFNLPLQHNEQW